jgi:ribosome-associated protein
MQPAIRDYYRLEEIWGEKPVKLKLADTKVSLVKASEDQDAAPVRKAAMTSARRTAPRKVAVETAGQAVATRKAPGKVSAKAPPKAAPKAAPKAPPKPRPGPLKATKTVTVNAPVKKVASKAPSRAGAHPPTGAKPKAAGAARKPVTRTVGMAGQRAAAPTAKPAARKTRARG